MNVKIASVEELGQLDGFSITGHDESKPTQSFGIEFYYDRRKLQLSYRGKHRITIDLCEHVMDELNNWFLNFRDEFANQ